LIPFSGHPIEIVLYAGGVLVTVIYFWQVVTPSLRRRQNDDRTEARTEELLRRYEAREQRSDEAEP